MDDVVFILQQEVDVHEEKREGLELDEELIEKRHIFL